MQLEARQRNYKSKPCTTNMTDQKKKKNMCGEHIDFRMHIRDEDTKYYSIS